MRSFPEPAGFGEARRGGIRGFDDVNLVHAATRESFLELCGREGAFLNSDE